MQGVHDQFTNGLARLKPVRTVENNGLASTTLRQGYGSLAPSDNGIARRAIKALCWDGDTPQCTGGAHPSTKPCGLGSPDAICNGFSSVDEMLANLLTPLAQPQHSQASGSDMFFWSPDTESLERPGPTNHPAQQHPGTDLNTGQHSPNASARAANSQSRDQGTERDRLSALQIKTLARPGYSPSAALIHNKQQQSPAGAIWRQPSLLLLPSSPIINLIPRRVSRTLSLTPSQWNAADPTTFKPLLPPLRTISVNMQSLLAPSPTHPQQPATNATTQHQPPYQQSGWSKFTDFPPTTTSQPIPTILRARVIPNSHGYNHQQAPSHQQPASHQPGGGSGTSCPAAADPAAAQAAAAAVVQAASLSAISGSVVSATRSESVCQGVLNAAVTSQQGKTTRRRARARDAGGGSTGSRRRWGAAQLHPQQAEVDALFASGSMRPQTSGSTRDTHGGSSTATTMNARAASAALANPNASGHPSQLPIHSIVPENPPAVAGDETPRHAARQPLNGRHSVPRRLSGGILTAAIRQNVWARAQADSESPSPQKKKRRCTTSLTPAESAAPVAPVAPAAPAATVPVPAAGALQDRAALAGAFRTGFGADGARPSVQTTPFQPQHTHPAPLPASTGAAGSWGTLTSLGPAMKPMDVDVHVQRSSHSVHGQGMGALRCQADHQHACNNQDGSCVQAMYNAHCLGSSEFGMRTGSSSGLATDQSRHNMLPPSESPGWTPFDSPFCATAALGLAGLQAMQPNAGDTARIQASLASFGSVQPRAASRELNTFGNASMPGSGCASRVRSCSSLSRGIVAGILAETRSLHGRGSLLLRPEAVLEAAAAAGTVAALMGQSDDRISQLLDDVDAAVHMEATVHGGAEEGAMPGVVVNDNRADVGNFSGRTGEPGPLERYSCMGQPVVSLPSPGSLASAHMRQGHVHDLRTHTAAAATVKDGASWGTEEGRAASLGGWKPSGRTLRQAVPECMPQVDERFLEEMFQPLQNGDISDLVFFSNEMVTALTTLVSSQPPTPTAALAGSPTTAAIDAFLS